MFTRARAEAPAMLALLRRFIAIHDMDLSRGTFCGCASCGEARALLALDETDAYHRQEGHWASRHAAEDQARALLAKIAGSES